ncbi:hypothetical protein C1N83_20765 [Priestia aryabhattai]|uniref:hypothetical protein n=1 Tax=Priestia TaxID=2800373 RepID=UPI00279D2B77|nr:MULTISPECIES: hypothetical protein [Priestia]MED4388854.1 hypothetical protein [Priestia aryabhattai]WDC90169.1 hypothetical protein PSR56_09070 [Priestia megaterium]
MLKGKRFLILFVLLISIAFFFFVLKEDGEIKRDNIEIGYKTNDESQQIIDPRNKVNRKKKIIVSTYFKDNSGKEKQNKTFVLTLANVKDKSNLLMEETIPNGEATSGYEFTISPGKLPAGKYQFSLYRDNNLSVEKVFTFK